MSEGSGGPAKPDDAEQQADVVEDVAEMAIEAVAGNPDQAWKMLSLVNDWIRHAEAKAAGTIATSGIAAGVLFNLLKDVNGNAKCVEIPAAICAALVAVAGLSAAWALRPRLWSREEPTSNLYFHHIARRHSRKSGGVAYGETVRASSAADAELIGEIAGANLGQRARRSRQVPLGKHRTLGCAARTGGARNYGTGCG